MNEKELDNKIIEDAWFVIDCLKPSSNPLFPTTTLKFNNGELKDKFEVRLNNLENNLIELRELRHYNEDTKNIQRGGDNE